VGDPKSMEHDKKRSLKKQLEALSPGDLICVDWYDASIGKSLGSGMAVDVPVKSWGVFVGGLGQKSKHIILAQNNFLYMDGVYDIDYTAIPVVWAISITVIVKNHVPPEEAKQILSSFLVGGRKRTKRKAQQRVTNHNEGLG
jgi:hypothetical protein